MTDLIKELRVWALKWPIQTIQGAYQFNEILSRHEQEEPLAVLADKKGYDLRFCRLDEFIMVELTHQTSATTDMDWAETECKNYAEAEAKARQYLMGLEDK